MNEINKSAMIDDLVELLRIRSVTGCNLGRFRCHETIRQMANRFGFNATSHASGQVMVVSPKGLRGQAKLGIIVHSDTVPVVEKEWSYNPYGEICSGRVYGRGVIDDKMGIITALYAMKELEGKIEDSWQIIIGSREEGQWTDMEEYLNENHPIPTFSITVDGDGIQHGCRGTINIMFEFPENGNVERSVKSIRSENHAWNVTPSKLTVTLDDGDSVTVSSEAMHSAFAANRKENAIYKMMCALREVFQNQFPGFVRFMDSYVETDNAETIGIEAISEFFKKEGFPDSSICPTLCQFEGGALRIGVNFRVSVGISKDDVTKALNTICEELGCTYEIYDATYASYVLPESEEIKMMLESYKKILGKETTSTFALGTGYNAVFPNCAIFGPRFDPDHDEEDLCHQADESRSIEDIYTFEEMLEDFVHNYLKR
jgi:succinyl-diaminopimelate desuccinylase